MYTEWKSGDEGGGEDIDRFIALKVFNCDNLYMFHCSRNAQATFKEKPQLKIY